MEYVYSALILGGVIAWFWHKARQIRKLKAWNFDWYRGEFPKLVSAGRVTCYKCGSSNIGTERLMQQTYLRAHVCRQCGTTLYYSPEQ